jgi:hypothetical protein
MLLAHRPFAARQGPKGNLIYKMITTTDHKLTALAGFITPGGPLTSAGPPTRHCRTPSKGPGRVPTYGSSV